MALLTRGNLEDAVEVLEAQHGGITDFIEEYPLPARNVHFQVECWEEEGEPRVRGVYLWTQGTEAWETHIGYHGIPLEDSSPWSRMPYQERNGPLLDRKIGRGMMRALDAFFAKELDLLRRIRNLGELSGIRVNGSGAYYEEGEDVLPGAFTGEGFCITGSRLSRYARQP